MQSVAFFLIAASLLRESEPVLNVLGAVALVMLLVGVAKQPLARPWPWPTEDWGAFLAQARQGPATFHYAPGWTVHFDLRDR